MQTSKTILKAMDLVADPENWTQKAMARNRYGNLSSPFDKNSCSFCVLGAIFKVSVENTLHAWAASSASGIAARVYLNEAIFASTATDDSCSSIADFNDSQHYAKVLELMTTAAFLALADESWPGQAPQLL